MSIKIFAKIILLLVTIIPTVGYVMLPSVVNAAEIYSQLLTDSSCTVHDTNANFLIKNLSPGTRIRSVTLAYEGGPDNAVVTVQVADGEPVLAFHTAVQDMGGYQLITFFVDGNDEMATTSALRIMYWTTGNSGAYADRRIFGTVADSENKFDVSHCDTSNFSPYIVIDGDTSGPTPQREPLVIVPGIMGSRLNKATGEEVWPSANQMLFSGDDSYLGALALNADGSERQGSGLSATDVIRSVTTSIPFATADYYRPLIDSFVAAGYKEGDDLFLVPYDWRFDANSTAPVIDATVRKAVAHSANGKVDIIAHSVGGLAVKEYLAHVSSTAFLDKLILAGVPQLGAPLAFKALNYGDDLGFHFGPFSFLNPDEVKSVAQNMPGIYQLLPSERYLQVNGGYIQDDRGGSSAVLSFGQSNQVMTADGSDSRNAGLLDSAGALHSLFDGEAFDAPEVYNILGCGNAETITGFLLQDEGSVDLVHGNGDGTVPAISAMNLADGYHNYFSLNPENSADHTGLIKDSHLIPLINAIITNTTSSLALAPLGISQYLDDCSAGHLQEHPDSETMIEVSIHGPADLDVYDEENDHTGMNASGSVDLGIPFSSFTKIGDNAFISMPSAKKYRVIATAKAKKRTATAATGDASSSTPITASSSTKKAVTVSVKKYNSKVKVAKKSTYINIPLSSSSTKISLTIESSTPDQPLSVDGDGDGIPDATVAPTAVLASSTAGDSVPPIIMMSAIPATTIFGAPVTFTFSALDEGSGVATTSATIDGRIIASGDTLTDLSVGNHLFEVEAFDRAGNVAAKSLAIVISSSAKKCKIK